MSKAILEAYDDAHSTALELGYPSLIEALEELADIKNLRDAQAAEIARLRAKIAKVKARGVAMQNDAYTDGEKYIGWGWECAGDWLEELAQEAQETQP